MGFVNQPIAVRLWGFDYIGVRVYVTTYMDIAGGIALQLEQNGEPLAVATVNLAPQGYELGPCCVWIKDYSENEGMLDSLIAAGVIELTGEVARSGFVTFQEARLLGEWAEEAIRVHHERTGQQAQIVTELAEENEQ